MTVTLPTALTGAPPDDGPGGQPVFVDSSGGRGRVLRTLGWMLVVAGLGYAVVLGVSLAGRDADAPGLLTPGRGKTLSEQPDSSKDPDQPGGAAQTGGTAR
ncbi:hypothetical protein [Streptomyces spirodelae]|uniref:Uncharacterized protein n=1 Tax=Streptomyces spirodelae TaxID=2812904 RepID=A0ABS3WQ70_9ACTN|nr:hypothetical protein [Streptomyces spirodelae]MBO8185261.1 hypothetical protein [Streptomyces spirodelae]